MYSQGGIFSITSRILVVDLLSRTYDHLQVGDHTHLPRTTESRSCDRSNHLAFRKVISELVIKHGALNKLMENTESSLRL